MLAKLKRKSSHYLESLLKSNFVNFMKSISNGLKPEYLFKKST